jgi:hypothetical protein
MKSIARVALLCLLPLSLAGFGCESISIIKRDDPFANDQYRRDRDIDRNQEARGDRNWDRAREEIVGTVQRVDANRREIQLRTTNGDIIPITYDLTTRVSNRDRDMRVEDLRYGDLVRIEFRRDRGERLAEVIRMNDRSDLGSSRW